MLTHPIVVCYSLYLISIPHVFIVAFYNVWLQFVYPFIIQTSLLVFRPYCWACRLLFFLSSQLHFKYMSPLFHFRFFSRNSEGLSFSFHFPGPGHQKCGWRKQIGHKTLCPTLSTLQVRFVTVECVAITSPVAVFASLPKFTHVMCVPWIIRICKLWCRNISFLGNIYVNITLPLNFTIALSTDICSEGVQNLAQAWFNVSKIIRSLHNQSYSFSRSGLSNCLQSAKITVPARICLVSWC